MSSNRDIEQLVESVRRFNRFYTQRIGVLHEGLLQSTLSLTEARVVYELAHLEKTTATQLVNRLSLDPGYVSRILTRFEKRLLVTKRRSKTDGRQSIITLTDAGRKMFRLLDDRSKHEVESLLAGLTTDRQQRLLGAMDEIQDVLESRPSNSSSYVLRPPLPGDMGWVISRHGAIYTMEYGWDDSFEALVAEIVAGIMKAFDPKRERCWIAEMNNQNVGSVFLVKKSPGIAKLRLLLIESDARGLGIGTRLVDECIRFSRQAGYDQITLWTQSILYAARHIYRKAGFQLIDSGPHSSFGADLIEETWVLDL